MQDTLRPYAIVCGVSLAIALAITLFVWAAIPVLGNPWPSVFWFALLGTLAELLAVTVQEDGVSVSPTSPILWAATSVLGPFPAVVAGASSGVLTLALRCGCFYASRRFTPKAASWTNAGSGLGARARDAAAAAVAGIGAIWQARSLFLTLEYVVWYVSNLVIVVGPAGLAYYLLGGKFLFDTSQTVRPMPDFVLPFLGLVAVSILAEHSLYVVTMSAINPIPGSRGLYALLLRARLAVIEVVIPLWRGQLFLIVVALLIAYLYSHIGLLGLVVAITPVIALRDFFQQWTEVKAAYVNTITTLATYMQLYHPYTRGHLKRVADISERLARELRLPADSIMHMSTAGFLHDIGKVGVSEEILDKTSKLTDEEWEKIKEHPVKGAEIVSHLEFLEGIVDWIKYHHKWHDGRGYPAGNGGDSGIPIQAGIIAVADAFDAMTDDRELTLDWKCDSCGYKPDGGARPDVCPECGSRKDRVYREPKSLDEAIDELRLGAGSQFDPRIVKAFLTMVERDGVHLNA